MLWGVSALKCSILQKYAFSRLSINRTCFLIEIAIKIFGLSLPDSIDVRSILDRSQLKNFQFLCCWPKFFFMHHLCLGFTCSALFLYPSCSFAIISLNVFTHNMHTLCYIRYSTWSKNWLINFWAMYFLVYAFFFYGWTVENICLKRYDG